MITLVVPLITIHLESVHQRPPGTTRHPHRCTQAVYCTQAPTPLQPTNAPQVDSPKDYASKVFTLINIALGLDPMLPEEGMPQSGGSSSEGSQSVEPEVVDPNDPWSRK